MGNLKVRFLPEGGFDKNGAFIEYDGDEPTGEETEYQRQAYLTLDIACSDFKVGTSLGVICEYEEVKERQYSRAIGATGVIQPARWGRYSLSFLGENRTTDRIAVSIRENAVGEAVTLAGLNMEGDLNIEASQEFFLEIDVHHERFAALLKELQHPDAVLQISVRADRFRDFYAQWSPSISEGRVIKFLDSKRSVENADEIPEDFWRSSELQSKLLSHIDRPPVTIGVGRPLQQNGFAPATAENEVDRDMDEQMPPPSAQPLPEPVPNPTPALEELSKRVRRGAFWVSLWLALIFVALILSL